MATTDLKFDEPGSLPRPGPIGRLARFAIGLPFLYYVHGLIQVSSDLIGNDGHIRSVVWNGVLFGLFLVSYVVNIGYSRAWKKWPAAVSVVVFAGIALFGYMTAGTVETTLLARIAWLWELYVFSHLGLAFVIAGIISTPVNRYGPTAYDKRDHEQMLFVFNRPINGQAHFTVLGELMDGL